MSSGSEFHKSQFILWGRVIDFFFIACFSFFFPPSCQASSTWIELFDLRAAVQKEEETPLLSFNTSPPCYAWPASLQLQMPAPKREQWKQQRRGGPWPGFPSLVWSQHTCPRSPLLCLHPHLASLIPVYVIFSYPFSVSFTSLRHCSGCPMSLPHTHHPWPNTQGLVKPTPICLSSHFSNWPSTPSWNIFYLWRYLYLQGLLTARGSGLVYCMRKQVLWHTQGPPSPCLCSCCPLPLGTSMPSVTWPAPTPVTSCWTPNLAHLKKNCWFPRQGSALAVFRNGLTIYSVPPARKPAAIPGSFLSLVPTSSPSVNPSGSTPWQTG